LVKGKLAAPTLFSGTTNTALFNPWLRDALLPGIGNGMTIILDHAIFHKSETTRALVKQAGCFLLFLPPYSSELIPLSKPGQPSSPHPEIILSNLSTNSSQCPSIK
jgi:transposase